MIQFIVGLLVGIFVTVTIVVLYLESDNKETEKEIADVAATAKRYTELYAIVCGRLADRNAEIEVLKAQLVEAHVTIERLEGEIDDLTDPVVSDKE